MSPQLETVGKMCFFRYQIKSVTNRITLAKLVQWDPDIMTCQGTGKVCSFYRDFNGPL